MSTLGACLGRYTVEVSVLLEGHESSDQALLQKLEVQGASGSDFPNQPRQIGPSIHAASSTCQP